MSQPPAFKNQFAMLLNKPGCGRGEGAAGAATATGGVGWGLFEPS